jgi:predicted dehydrogenase
MFQIGVIGYGYWGPNLVRNFSDLKDARVAAVCDQRPDQLALVRGRYSSVHTTTEVEEIFANPKIDAVAIATPASTHFDLAKRALRAGKHVWVEKPLTTTGEEAQLLAEETVRARRVLLVDHTFVYTGAVRKIQELLLKKSLGELYYYHSVRVNLGLFQHDMNVIWDLGVHDLAIIDFLFAEKPVAVSATGISHFPGQPENVAYITLFFPGRQIAHVHVNWLAPVKVRQTLIGGSEKMVLWDDAEASEKVKVYDKGILVNNSPECLMQKHVGYRTGDMWAPQLDRTEALLTGARHFLNSIRENQPPLTDVRAGLRVVRTLEAASKSMELGGQQVILEEDRALS